LVRLALGLLVAASVGWATGPAAVARSGASIADGRYESPTYGYTLEWDESWEIGQEFSERGYDLLQLARNQSTLWIEGQQGFAGDYVACLEDSVAAFDDEPGVSDVDPVLDEAGEPIVEDDGTVALAVYTFTVELDEGDPREGAALFACATLLPGEAVIEVTHLAPRDDFEAEVAAAAEVLESLTIPSPEEIAERSAAPEPGGQAADPTERLVAVMDGAAADIDAFWAEIFATSGVNYESPAVVFYDQTIENACGVMEPLVVGPHYCPLDETIYLDVPFMELAVLPFGEFAAAFVVAHEWGHHVQHLLELEKCQIQECLGGFTSLELELQADCFAGAWTRFADDQGQLGFGDAESAVVVLAQLVGDPEGTRVYDRAVHGPGSLRAYWFLQGYYGGLSTCLEGME
jgi:predicted metalloprotease